MNHFRSFYEHFRGFHWFQIIPRASEDFKEILGDLKMLFWSLKVLESLWRVLRAFRGFGECLEWVP